MNWYVVRTEAKCEFVADESLKSYGYKTFLPVEKVWIRHARRKQERTRPLLPRYLFVSFELGHPWARINAIDGVERLLRSATDVPVKVPSEIVDTLRGAIEVGVYDETRTGWQGAKPGDPLLLVEGPFRDLIAKLKLAKPDKRVDIVINLFGGDRTIDVPLAWVRPV